VIESGSIGGGGRVKIIPQETLQKNQEKRSALHPKEKGTVKKEGSQERGEREKTKDRTPPKKGGCEACKERDSNPPREQERRLKTN